MLLTASTFRRDKSRWCNAPYATTRLGPGVVHHQRRPVGADSLVKFVRVKASSALPVEVQAKSARRADFRPRYNRSLFFQSSPKSKKFACDDSVRTFRGKVNQVAESSRCNFYFVISEGDG